MNFDVLGFIAVLQGKVLCAHQWRGSQGEPGLEWVQTEGKMSKWNYTHL